MIARRFDLRRRLSQLDLGGNRLGRAGRSRGNRRRGPAHVDDLAGHLGHQDVDRGLRDLGRLEQVLAGSTPNALVRIGVAVRSGLMQFTRTPTSSHSSASAWVRLTTAALLEEYRL